MKYMYCPYCASKELEEYMPANKYHKELFRCFKCRAIITEDTQYMEEQRIKNKRKKEEVKNKEKKQKTKIKYINIFLVIIFFYFLFR